MGFIVHCCGCVPGGGVTLPGCPCTNIAETLTVDVVGQTGSTFFVDGVMTWRTVPADVSGLYPASPAFWSDVLDYGGGFGIRYRWGMMCEGGFYRLRSIVVEDPAPPVAVPYIFDTTTYIIPGSGNTCSPFALTNGSNSLTVNVDVLA